MGSGSRIFDYNTAADMLLSRTYPEIENGTQKNPIFIPETFLPSYSAAVDPDHFQDQLNKLYENNEKQKSKELRASEGNFAERMFFDELQKVVESRGAVVVLHNSEFLCPKYLTKPGCQQGLKNESDFIIIDKKNMFIMVLEIKYNLFCKALGNVKETSIVKGLKQISKIKLLLETFFCGDIDVQNWRFVGALGYMKINEEVVTCESCQPFVVQHDQLSRLFDSLHNENKDKDSELVSVENDFKFIIKNILFTVFANPGPVTRSKVDDEVFKKIVGQDSNVKPRNMTLPGEDLNLGKLAQGDYRTVLFWTPTQFDLLQLDEKFSPKYRKVLFTSSMSTGKTEVMKGMIQKLLNSGQKCHFIFYNHRCNKKTLLQLQIELEFEKFEDNIEFSTVICHDNGISYTPGKPSEFPDTVFPSFKLR